MTDPDTTTQGAPQAQPTPEAAAAEAPTAPAIEAPKPLDPLASAQAQAQAAVVQVSAARSALVARRTPPPAAAPAPRAPVPAASFAGFTFHDESDFLGDVGRAVLGAAAAGLIAHTVLGGSGAGSAFGWVVALAVTGALAAIGSRSGGLLRGIQSAAFGVLGGWLYSRSLPEWPLLGAMLLGAAAAPVLARGETGTKLAATGVLTGVLALAGAYVAEVLAGSGVLDSMVPPFLATSAASGALGLFVGLGAVPRYLSRGQEPVEGAYARALASSSGEVHEILDRSLVIYRAIREDLAGRPAGKTEAALTSRVSDLAMRILQIGQQCRDIERDLGAAPAQVLEDRITALRNKADSATDPAARATFLATVDSLDAQKKAIEAIGRGLERVVARLHANVALLEKVRFSLVHARSADAERSGSEASPLTDTIDELSRELDATSMAVGEVYGKA